MNLLDRLRSVLRVRANPVIGDDYTKSDYDRGVGDNWAPSNYADYYPKSVPVYAALRLRQDAIASVPLKVYGKGSDGALVWLSNHPAQTLMDHVNDFWTRGDLWRATETYLGLWGSAYWFLERDDAGHNVTAIWPLRPDRMKIVPDPDTYIKGFIYGTGSVQTARVFLPEEIVWMRYFNPKDEYAGLSPIAPLRLSVDMHFDALRANRAIQNNDASAGMYITTSTTPSDEEVKAFYRRWEDRYKGVGKRGKPALLAKGMDVKNLGFSPKDMEYIQSLRWGIEDVARAYNVPPILLQDLTRSTYSNYAQARRAFWDAIVHQLVFYEERLNEMLFRRHFGGEVVAKFDLSGVEALQEDENDKAARRKLYVEAGIMTPNEVRGELGLEALPQEGANDLILPGAGAAGPFAFAAPGGKTRRSLFDDLGPAADTRFRAILDPLERGFRAIMRRLFEKQLDSMLKRLEEHRAAHPLRSEVELVAELAAPYVAYQHVTTQAERTNGHAAQRQGGPEIFRPQDWWTIFIEAGAPGIAKGVTQGARSSIGQFSLGIAFDVKRPIPAQWVKARTKFWASRVNEETGRLVLQEVLKANELGESIPQLADRIKNVGVVNDKVRAERIARTEMVGAQNEGHVEAYEQSGLERKQWWTTIDDRQRTSHDEAHRQIRNLREDFQVGSDSMRAPGQGSEAGENINCRCVVLPVFE